MAIRYCYAGTLRHISGTFTTPVTGQGIDPSVVTLVLAVNGTETRWTYGEAGSPIQRSAAGAYYADLDTTTRVGTWVYWWESTGVGQGVSTPHELVVNPLPD